MDSRKKLLIVDDSAFMRKLISDFFIDNLHISVIGTARNGKDALKKIQQLKPDIITLDVEMPEMNGLETLKEIMKMYPIPVIMLSSTTKSGAENTLKAIEYGAVDFVAKPSGTISLDLHKIRDELIDKVVAGTNVSMTNLKKRTAVEPTLIKPKLVDSNSINQPVQEVSWNHNRKKIVVIGTSTGGPRALQAVLTKLPKSIRAPILIVQHMPAKFTKSLAERLNHQSEIEVKEAVHGELLKNGTAYIAPGGYHLKVRKVGHSYTAFLDQSDPVKGHRPSVDVLFDSVAQLIDCDKVAVIMTGMGSDGTEGLGLMKRKGTVRAIAESEQTSIVFGMPKSAIEAKLIDIVSDLDQIAYSITKLMSKG